MRTINVLAFLMLTLSGCIVGRVISVGEFGQQAAVSGATVTISPCKLFQTGDCAPLGPFTTDSNGYYWYDPYQPGNPFIYPMADNKTYQIEVSHPNYTGPQYVYHTPEWHLETDPFTGEDKYTTLVDDIFVTNNAVSSGVDTDNDGLSDDIESWYFGTDPNNPDTDGDGLADASEVYGINWAPMPQFGTDPLHKDLLVEVDTATRSPNLGGFLTPILLAATEYEFATLGISNPDGTSGIRLRLINDKQYTYPNFPTGFCTNIDQSGANWTTANSNQDWIQVGFRYMQICPIAGSLFNGQGSFPYQGGSTVGGAIQIKVNWDRTVSNDFTEQNGGVFTKYLIPHEIGHTMWLSHAGGVEGTGSGIPEIYCGNPFGVIPAAMNYKPNYPSLMNYSYRYGLNDWTPQEPTPTFSLQDWDAVGFSDGSRPDIDESCMSEAEPWYLGGPEPSYLRAYENYNEYGDNPLVTHENASGPISVVQNGNGDWRVDWDGDGTHESWEESWIARYGAPFAPAPSILRDYDDFTAIEHGLPHGVPLASPVFDPSTGEPFTVLRPKGSVNPPDWIPAGGLAGPYMPHWGQDTPHWEEKCAGEAFEFMHCRRPTPEPSLCGWTPQSCTYVPDNYCEGRLSPVKNRPTLDSDLAGFEEVVLSKFSGKSPRELDVLIREAGFTEEELSFFVSMIYDPTTYSEQDPIVVEERTRREVYERAGKYVEFVDCEKLDKSRIESVLRSYRGEKHVSKDRKVATHYTSDDYLSLQFLEVCR